MIDLSGFYRALELLLLAPCIAAIGGVAVSILVEVGRARREGRR